MNLSFDSPIRVLIVDDHQIVRNGLVRLLLEYDDLEVAGEAEDSTAALELVASTNPDVVLVDIKLARESGINLARQILHKWPEVRIIILTSYDDEGYLTEAARIGVHGYLLKSTSPELLAEAIRAANRGERRLSPVMADKALGQVRDLVSELSLLRSGLSAEELTILSLIADGASVTTIAQKMNFCERTVKRKTQEILEKLGASNRVQAVAEAIRRGLV